MGGDRNIRIDVNPGSFTHVCRLVLVYIYKCSGGIEIFRFRVSGLFVHPSVCQNPSSLLIWSRPKTFDLVKRACKGGNCYHPLLCNCFRVCPKQ